MSRFAATVMLRAGWAPLGLFILHLLMMRVWRAYARWPAIDIPMHFVGGMAIAWFFQVSVATPFARHILGPLTRWGQALMVLALTATAAVVWEFGEWGVQAAAGQQLHGDSHDTMLDLLLGCLGGTLLVLLVNLQPSQPRADAVD